MNLRRLFFLFFTLVFANIIFAQVPQAFHYQMVVRDANDVLVRSHAIGLQLTIQRNNSGSPVILYQETQTATTDQNGLLQIQVGRGTRNTTYGEFNAIPWGTYTDIELKTEADPAGGTSYTLSATQPLQAVPYAFMADEHQDLANAAALGNRAGNYQLKSVKDPTDPQDVITKRYLDSVLAELVRRSNTLTRDTAACVNPSATPFAWRGQSISIASTGSHTYTHTMPGAGAGGLDSIIILTLRVDEGTHNVNIINQAGAYTWHGNNYASTGTYTYAYTDGNGCPSVDTLKLTISAAVVYGDTTPVEKCGSFTWYGTPLLASGDYTHTFVGAGPGGVDSILRLHLTIKPLGNRTLTETRCDTYHWDLEDADYTSTGTYSHTITGGSANGCDSIVRLELTINQTVYRDSAANECEHFTWYGNDYTTTGPQSKTFSGGATNGCDSTIRLALTIRPKATGTDVHSACDSYDWIDGNHYTASNNTATHTFPAGAANGCDSIVTLNLTINSSTAGTDNQTACDSYTWTSGNGNTYTVSNNTAVHHTTNVAGCDSAITLNLTLNQSTSAIDQQVACDSYTWIDGNSYTSNNNTATHRLDNAAGCDSNITLNLTVNASTSANRTVNVCGEVGTWGTLTYPATAEGAAYTIDSVNNDGCPYTVNLRVYNRSYTGAGLKHVYVCANTSSYVYHDTIYFNDFDGANASTITYGSGASQWKRGGYGSPTEVMGLYDDMDGRRDYNYGDGQSGHNFLGQPGGVYNMSAVNNGYNIYWIISPGITITNPSNTYASFRYSIWPNTWNPTYYGSTDAFLVGFHTTREYDFTGKWMVASEDAASWQSVSSRLSDINVTAGTWYFKMEHQDYWGDGVGVDNLLIYEEKSVNLSSTPNGSDYTGLVTNTNAYGCPSAGMVIHKLSAGETYTESACESYRWINGTDYTTNQVNTAYAHTVHGCSVTDHLNLTINTPASTGVSKSATNNYTWATSGSYGHGTGLTYGYSGNYIGPYYATGACQSRDTLHLTIENTCAGLRSAQTVCADYTWPVSGVKGHGTGTNYTVGGTYIGPSYNTLDCNGLHDTLDLTIMGNVTEDFYMAACDSYTWPANSQTYTSVPGSAPSATLTSAAGCDSTVTLYLTLNSSTSNTTTPSYCGGSYTWSVNGQTYTEAGTYLNHSVNYSGCPHTERLVLVDGNEYNVVRDTICMSNPTVISYDTIASYDFEDDMDDSDWGVWSMCNAGGWNFYEQCYGYSPRTGSGQLAAPDEGRQCFGGDFANGVYRYTTMAAINFCWSAAFTITDPTNTTLEFWYQKPSYNDVKGVLRVYIVPTSNWLVPDLSGTEVLNCGGSVTVSSWTKAAYNFSALSAGTYRLKFVHQDNDGDHNGIDDVIIYRRVITDYSAYTPGTTIEDVTSSPIANGCNRITGTTHYLQPTTGYTNVVSACDSYTWVDNGTTVGTYTESGTYTHSYTVNGCNITNTILLTINPSGSGNEYGCNCVANPVNCPGSSYTWPTSGLNGHGTGQTYTSNGTYVGPTYIDANGCYARDTLKLRIM